MLNRYWLTHCRVDWCTSSTTELATDPAWWEGWPEDEDNDNEPEHLHWPEPEEVTSYEPFLQTFGDYGPRTYFYPCNKYTITRLHSKHATYNSSTKKHHYKK